MKVIFAKVLTASVLLLAVMTALGQPYQISNSAPSTVCGNASGFMSLTTGGATVIRWEVGTFNGTFTVEQTFITSNSSFDYSLTAPAMKAYRAYCNGPSGLSYTNVQIVIANTNVTAGTIVSSQPTEYHLSGSGMLTASGYTGANVAWEKSLDGFAWVGYGSGATVSYSGLSETTQFRTIVSNSNYTCSAISSPFEITVFKPGVLATTSGVDGAGFAVEGSLISLSIAGNYTGIARWEYSVDDGVTWTLVSSTGTSYSHRVMATTRFRALVNQGPFPQTYTNVVEVLRNSYTEANAATNQVSGLNYVKTQQVVVEGIVDPAVVDGLPSSQKRQTISYLDGLGRQIQHNINKAGAVLGNDIVVPAVYGHEGIATTAYLPYVSSLNNGSYVGNAVAAQAAFYDNGASDKIEDSAYPFSKMVIEKSPLRLITEAGSAGSGFQPGQGHTKSMAYLVNDLNEVRLFNSDGSSSGFYPENELAKLEITDEDGKKVQTFTDRAGKTILKRQQLDETIGGTLVPWLETYHIYNSAESAKYIISPKGVLELKANGWSFPAIKDQYVHEFVYDQRGRLIERKVPGQAWIYYGYDRLNRIVLVQDGNIRGANKWFFVKYDRSGRPVIRGLYQNTTHTTRAAIQLNVLDPLYALDTDKHFENRGSVLHGYTNQSFPTTNTEVLSVDYFDTHDFDFNGTNDYSYTPQSLLNENVPAGSSFGKATGYKRLVLGASTWLYSYVFYDNHGRAIQERTNNHLSTTSDNLATLVYDFEGKIKTKKVYHNAGSGRTMTVINKFDYDNMGRILKIYQNNNAAPTDQLVVKIEYNELGQPIDKKLHEVSTNTFLQSIDLRYNIRGWLTSINNSSLTSDGIMNDETGDLFGIEYLYEKTETGLITSSDVMYNGNVSAIKWKGAGMAAGVGDQSSYRFTFDKSNRLKTSTSQMNDGIAWSKEAGALNENTTYDVNGNILSLYRNHRKHQISGGMGAYTLENIDNLTYTYNTGMGDQLMKITDATTHASGFDNGMSGAADDYTYDVNGNLLTDANKDINGVVYNDFGKATQITFSDTRKIEYVYSVDGRKLTMNVFAAGNGTPTTTDYINEFVYENGNLSFFASPGGRVVKNGASLEYQYAICDQQGNTRVLFTSASPAPTVASANFESSMNSDFPNYASTYRSPRPEFDSTDPMAGTSTYSQLLTGGYNAQLGVAKSFKVYPGDKVKVDAYAKYQSSSGGSSNLANFASALTSAFGYATAPAGEALKAYNALNSFGSLVAGGTGHSNNPGNPLGFVTILLFDKDYKFLDAAWDQIDASASEPVPPTYNAFDLLTKEVTIREEGYAYVYISNESPTLVDIYFDDVVMTHTKTSVVQYNEYYPFGLQTSRSWTREGSNNDFLYNDASELNRSTGWYETFFRNYDATIGRFTGIDPLATKYGSFSGYHYAFNNPIMFNDPSGADAYMGNDPTGYAAYMVAQARRNSMSMTNAEWIAYSRPGGPSVVDQMSLAGTAELNGIRNRNSGSHGSFSTLEDVRLYIDARLKGTLLPEVEITSLRDGRYPDWWGDSQLFMKAQQGGNGLWNSVAGGDGFRLQYSEGLNKTLSTLGGVAGAFESGAAIGTFQSTGKVAFSTIKSGLQMTKVLGNVGIGLTVAVAGHELVTGHDNTHTWVDLGVTALGVGAAVVFGTAALPAVAIGGLAYGIWSFSGGSDWIDSNWGYRDPK